MAPDNATVFISIGTTPEMVAQALLAKKGLTVVTNNLNAAMAFSALVVWVKTVLCWISIVPKCAFARESANMRGCRF